MKRLINYRPLFYFAIGLCGGIYFLYSATIKDILPIIFITLILIFYVFLSVFNKIDKRKTFVIIFGIIIGVVCSEISICSFKDKIKTMSTYYGVVENIQENETLYILILKDCKNLDTNEKLNNKNVLCYIYINGECEYKLGDEINFSGDLRNVDIINESGISNYYYNNNIAYTISINSSSEINVIGNKKNIFQLIRQSIYNRLFNNDNVDEEIASLSYSVLVGDKNYISDEDKNIFSKTGLAHILSISGLHITMLCYLIGLLFNKKRHKLNFLVISIFLIFYLFVCGFSLSAVRSVIMTICLTYSNYIAEWYDNLSSLSLAVIIILIISPFSLFNSGFLLSVLSVFAIISIYPLLIKRVSDLLNISEKNFLLSSILLVVSIQLVILPILIMLYDEVNFLSFIFNLLIVPIFTIYYITLLPITLIVLIIPNLSFLYIIPNYICNLIFSVSEVCSLLPTTITIDMKSINNITYVVYLYYVIIYIISKFVMANVKTKSIAIASIMVIMTIISIIPNYSLKEKGIYVVGSVTNCFVVDSGYNEITVFNVGNTGEVNNLVRFLDKLNITHIDNLIISKFTGEEIHRIKKIEECAHIENIYIEEDVYNDDTMKIYINYFEKIIDNSKILTFKDNQKIILNEVIFENISTTNGSGMVFNYLDKNILIINSGNKNNTLFQNDIEKLYQDIYAVRVHTYTHIYDDNMLKSTYYFININRNGEHKENIIYPSQYSYIKFYFQKNNLINLKFIR